SRCNHRSVHRSTLGTLFLALFSMQVLTAQPSVGLLNPSVGSGTGFTFTLAVSDQVAATNIGFTELLFNSSLNGANACYLRYDQSGGVIYLRDDSSPTWIDSGAPGTAATLRNSQCSIDLSG